MNMHKGWLLNKPKFHDSYETVRLVEEFKNHNIDVKCIENVCYAIPDIAVDVDDRQFIVVKSMNIWEGKFMGLRYIIKHILIFMGN